MSKPPQQKELRPIDKIILICLTVLLVGFLGVTVSRLIYPFDLGSHEGSVWMPARIVAEGHNPYSFALKPPFSMAPYGYVYYFLVGLGVKLFGLQLWFGRVLSIAACFLTAFAVARIAAAVTENKKAVPIAWIACLSPLAIQSWMVLQRSDFIATAFAFLGLSLIFTARRDDENKFFNLFLPVLLFAAAFFTKHTAAPLAMPIGALLCLGRKKYASGAGIFFGTSLLIAAGMLALNLTSDGGYIWQHFTHAKKLPVSLGKSFSFFIEVLKTPTAMVFLLMAGAAIFIARKNFTDALRSLKLSLRQAKIFDEVGARRLIILYFCLSLGFAFLSSGRHGGTWNYYLEVSFVAAIVIAIIYDRLARREKFRLAAGFIVLLALGGAFQLVRLARGEYFRWQSLAYHREIVAKIEQLTPPGSVGFSACPELLVAAGRDFYFDDIQEYMEEWSPELHQAFEAEFTKKSLSAVILRTSDVPEKDFRGYRLVKTENPPPERFHRVYLYVRE